MVLLARVLNGHGDQQNSQSFCRNRNDDVCHALWRSKIVRHDKRVSQIVTPDLESEGDLGLTDWAEVAVFRGFQPDEWIFGTEIGLLRNEPYLLSIGFINWSPHLDEDAQPFIEAGYWGKHHKLCAGLIHAGYKNEAILGYAYDFNERWRFQVDWQSGSENSST